MVQVMSEIEERIYRESLNDVFPDKVGESEYIARVTFMYKFSSPDPHNRVYALPYTYNIRLKSDRELKTIKNTNIPFVFANNLDKWVYFDGDDLPFFQNIEFYVNALLKINNLFLFDAMRRYVSWEGDDFLFSIEGDVYKIMGVRDD